MYQVDATEMFTNIRIAYPLRVTSLGGEEYFQYVTEVTTNDPSFTLSLSRTWRRYSEFRQLKTILARNNLTIEIPALPTQGIFRDRLHPLFLESRRAGLETFLKQVVAILQCKADRALHLFLQTSLSIEDIVKNIEGTRHDKIETTNVDLLWWSVMTNNDTRPVQKEETGRDSTNHPVVKPPKPTKHVTFCDEVKAISAINSTPVNYDL